MNILTSTEALGGIIAFLVALVVSLMWRLRSTDKEGLGVQISLLRSEITSSQVDIVVWLRRVEDRLNACQAEQKQCPMKYVGQVALTAIMEQFKGLYDKVEIERREAWRRQDELNKRQEILNLAMYRMLDEHHHAFNNNGTVGKAVGIVKILEKT